MRYEVCPTPEFDHFAIFDNAKGRRVYNTAYPGYWRFEEDAQRECDTLNYEAAGFAVLNSLYGGTMTESDFPAELDAREKFWEDEDFWNKVPRAAIHAPTPSRRGTICGVVVDFVALVLAAALFAAWWIAV